MDGSCNGRTPLADRGAATGGERPLRIAVIAPPWTPVPPPYYGGTEVVVDQLARGLHQAGHRVMLFTTGDSTCPVPRRWALGQAEGDRIGHGIPEMRHVVHAYEAAKGFDIVHDHTTLGPVYAERFPVSGW